MQSKNSHHIVVVGAGVVGYATGRGFIKKGNRVTFVDVNSQRIEELKREGAHACHADEVNWEDCDIVMLAVSTPTKDGAVFLDHIKAAAADVGRGLRHVNKFIPVVVRSTVPPTTTEQIITPILEEASGKVAGADFGVAMNPEFLRQKTAVQDFATPWITVIGTLDNATRDILSELFNSFGGLLVTTTPTEAEMIKYVNNIYNAVKISYFNEVHQICEELNIDSNRVTSTVARSAESMWNPLYGTRGGVPYGGACLPKDTTAFIKFCNENGWEHKMLDATIDVNEQLAEKVAPAESPDQIEDILKESNTPQPIVSNGYANGTLSTNGVTAH